MTVRDVDNRSVGFAWFILKNEQGWLIPLPSVAPGTDDGVGVFVAAEAAVETGEGADDVAVFDVEVVAQDGAAVAQVGADIEQVVVGFADVTLPEWHDLHQAFCADVADGILAERAFHFDQAEYQLCI